MLNTIDREKRKKRKRNQKEYSKKEKQEKETREKKEDKKKKNKRRRVEIDTILSRQIFHATYLFFYCSQNVARLYRKNQISTNQND